MAEDEDYAREAPYDASDPAAVNAARKRATRIRKKRLDFVKAMMSMQEGRLWINDLLESCYIFGNPLIPGQTDVTFFNIGQQNVAKKILADINEAAPEKYMLMLKEAKAEK